jgi:hypothetical protein
MPAAIATATHPVRSRLRPRARGIETMRWIAAAAAAVVAGAVACGDGADKSAFCAAAERLRDDPALLAGDVTQEKLDQIRDIFDELADTAPESVSDDADLLRETVARLAEGDVSFIADPEQAARVDAALDALRDYRDDEC